MTPAWLLLLFPLAAASAVLLGLRQRPGAAISLSVGSATLCFLLALGVAAGAITEPTPWTWLSFPGFRVEVGMIFDPLARAMLLVVTGVGLLVHIFSIGYMAHDPSRARFFGGLSIFMFSMTGIVLASNLIMLFFFWEGVGLSSYLLIGFWFTRDSAALAANKAFVCNRLADFGFMAGILLFWFLFQTVSVRPADLQALLPLHARVFALPLETLLVLGLFSGCVGKSAMFPLHVWLPDAMEGPTPVSALIHAATMVAAGVYMLCRVFPILTLSPDGLFVIASIGCFTAVFAALIAVQQNDIKRILAYSTLSQLGYMVMAVGSGAPAAAMFHLTTHAFFKALLFLAAGSVIHALHEEQDIWKMGGLARKIPLTFWTFAIGTLALIGLPPFAGFFSKDFLLANVYAAHPLFYGVGVFTAFLTAFYMTRLLVVTFLGPARTSAAHHPHESPSVMTLPLIALAILSTLGGLTLAGIGLKNYFQDWMAGVPSLFANAGGDHEQDEVLATFLPSLFVVAGVAAGFLIYRGRTSDPLHLRVLARKFYFDEFYDRGIVAAQQLFACALAWIDSWILEGCIVRGLAGLSVGCGEILRLFQAGNLQAYAFLFGLGGGLLIYFTLFAH